MFHVDHIQAYHVYRLENFHPSCCGGWEGYQHHVWHSNLNLILSGGLTVKPMLIESSDPK